MDRSVKTKKLSISGMTCVNCENKIQKKLIHSAGIKKAEVSYVSGTALITYDTDIISLKDIYMIIKKLGYETAQGNPPDTKETDTLSLLMIILGLYMIMNHFGFLNLLAPSQLAETNMGYGMLFVIGLVTSVHCIAMCGGINLSQCINNGSAAEEKSLFLRLRPAFLYNFGRVISYTAVGFIVGALGSVITFSNFTQGVLKLLAGVFMVIMGLNMLNVFPRLRKLNPRMPKIFGRRIDAEKSKSKSPLIVGLLNGLMPCGPLQAMQIYALSTGSPFEGAFSMFLFSMGTVPLMFTLSVLSSVLSKKFSSRFMTIGAVLVAVLGLSMVSQGWSLTGIDNLLGRPSIVNAASDNSGIVMEDGIQVVKSTLSPGRYPAITVQDGIPVKWIIDAPEGSINGCNNRIFIKEYGIEYSFKKGENIIEFTPKREGSFRYSCWMGMIRSTITVIGEEEAGKTDSENGASSQEANILPDDDKSIPANYVIPADKIATAEITSQGEYKYQTVTIELTDKGFSPAIAVLQEGIETIWIIHNKSVLDSNFMLLIPSYGTAVEMGSNENQLYLYPTESFDFSNGDSSFFGFIKIVPDVNSIDYDSIKAEAKTHETFIWPLETFQQSDGASCH